MKNNTELVDGILDIDQSDLLNTPVPRKQRKYTFRENLPSYLLGASISLAILFGLTLYLLSKH